MYKTILVHVDSAASAGPRIDAAARLAIQNDAHLVGAALSGLSSYMFPVGGFDPGLPAITFPFDELRAEAERALDAFETRVRQAGVNSYERRNIDDEAGYGICMQARYADVVVISQGMPDDLAPRLRADFPEYVLLNCARPVLIVPPAGIPGGFAKKVTVGWNGSADAVRAITSAVPLLQRSERADLAVFDAESEGDLHGPAPGADMALYLARHGIRVEVTSADAGHDAGAALLAHAADRSSDLIVMGAYGHSRFREILLGGATRTVLRSSRLPLWMAH